MGKDSLHRIQGVFLGGKLIGPGIYLRPEEPGEAQQDSWPFALHASPPRKHRLDVRNWQTMKSTQPPNRCFSPSRTPHSNTVFVESMSAKEHRVLAACQPRWSHTHCFDLRGNSVLQPLRWGEALSPTSHISKQRHFTEKAGQVVCDFCLILA